MSTYNNTFPVPRVEDPLIAVIDTEWNHDIAGAMADGCVARLEELGYDAHTAVERFTVPGAVELTYAASQLIETGRYDAVIAFGCVIRGGTPHFDYVCQSVTQGVTLLNSDCDIPVIFGVLTTDNRTDALDRLSKGPECADTALKMIAFARYAKEL